MKVEMRSEARGGWGLIIGWLSGGVPLSIVLVKITLPISNRTPLRRQVRKIDTGRRQHPGEFNEAVRSRMTLSCNLEDHLYINDSVATSRRREAARV